MFTECPVAVQTILNGDRKSTRLNSSHANISYAVFCLKKKRGYEGTAGTHAHTEARRRRCPVLVSAQRLPARTSHLLVTYENLLFFFLKKAGRTGFFPSPPSQLPAF